MFPVRGIRFFSWTRKNSSQKCLSLRSKSLQSKFFVSQVQREVEFNHAEVKSLKLDGMLCFPSINMEQRNVTIQIASD
jgi:hypothetical protein